MGSKSSKQKDGTKAAKSKKAKKLTEKNTPRNEGSTQSLNVVGSENVSSSPSQNAYSPLEQEGTLSRGQSMEDLRVSPPPCPAPRIKPPPAPVTKAENRRETETDNQWTLQRKHSTGDSDEYLQEKKVYHSPESKKTGGTNVYDSPESSSKPKVRATMNYMANYETDISFKKGDILQLINDGEIGGWYFVKNLTTNEEGNVHKNWVTMITNTSNVDIESQKCFFKLDREEAEEKLLEPETKLGTYLIRPSGDDYALSLRCENKSGELEIRHYKIRVVDKGICYIEADSNSKPFNNITDMIKFYTQKPGLRCKLKTPLPQDIPLDDLTVKFSDLKLGEKIGSGNFGSVYAGTLHNNKQVAVKSLNAGGSMTIKEFRKEAETMHKLRHPKLVSLLAICDGNDKIYIITERMSKGDLLDLLRKDTYNTIKFTDIMDMAIQVAEGMCYLEKKGFVHRDLRAANVLVGDGNIAKIADFGLARLLDSYYEHEDFYKEKKGTVLPVKWTAPEALKQMKFTVKSDVWSFGILLYEMVTHGDEPYADMTKHEAVEWLDKGNRLKKPTEHHCPLALYNVMRQCWLKNANERPTFDYIKDNLIEIKTIG